MRVVITLAACLGLVCCGCVEEEITPAPLPTAQPSPTANDAEEPVPADHAKTAEEAADKPADEKSGDTASETLKLSGGVSFTTPKGWKKVPVKGNIPEAEFALPKLEGDEHDGRLTLMSAGGGLEQNVSRWKGEFNNAEEPKIETMKIDGIEATVVDIRGEWKGTSFRPVSPPRPDHRMIAVFIPLNGPNAYYVKITGPKATLAKRDDEIQKFLKSAHVDKSASQE